MSIVFFFLHFPVMVVKPSERVMWFCKDDFLKQTVAELNFGVGVDLKDGIWCHSRTGVPKGNGG